MMAIDLSGCNRSPSDVQLIRAIASDDEARITQLLKDHDININETDDEGVTAVLQSLLSNNKDAYKMLLKKGANPNVVSRDGRSVMNVAASRSDGYWLSVALEHGGDANLANAGNTKFPNSTPIYSAIRNLDVVNEPWHAENVKKLIQAGARVSHRDGFGETPLLVAAKAGEVVVLLLEAGADPTQKDNSGVTTVDWFDGRTSEMVPEPDQRLWFGRAVGMLEARGLSERPDAGIQGSEEGEKGIRDKSNY
jgi:ankyrin repeat protein